MYFCVYVYICMCECTYLLFYIAVNQITRPFVECFEKGTPNFVSVPPCEFVLYVHEAV